MRIEKGQRYLVDKDTTLSEELECLGDFEFDPNKSATLSTSKNIIIRGKIFKMKPANAGIVHRIRFINVDETRFIGGGLNPIASDIGLWVMGEGTADLQGSAKTTWTYCNEVKVGAVSITVKEASGWVAGNEIVIATTDTPPEFTVDWIDSTNTLTDSFLPRFERRIIKSVSGLTVFFDGPLKYNHLKVDDILPPVANLTKNVKIEGTPTGRAHTFFCAHGDPGVHYVTKHNIDGVQFSHLGPRKGSPRPQHVLGRYGLHFHHGGTGTEGSIVQNCTMHDIGNRGYVPHMAHGITFRNNVCFNSLETQFFWDWQEITHRTTYDSNLMMASRQNGIGAHCSGMEMNMGDDNTAKNNVAVYCHNGDLNGAGAYNWSADSEGVWNFDNNISIACRNGLWVWQNSVYVHIVKGYRAYNCFLSMLHGAYGNMYLYTKNRYFNSKNIAKASASAGNTGYENTVFDGNNQLNELCEVLPSPIPSSATPNVFRSCTFKNGKIGILLNCMKDNPDNEIKIVDVIGCDFINVQQQFAFGPGPLNSYFRVQDKAGNATKITKTGTTTIPRFAPLNYGTGEGLKGDYYNGANFESLALSRVDPMIYYQQWRKDKPIYPLGVNAKIKGTATTTEPFSIRWTGKIEAQWSEPHVFRFMGGSAYRLWIDNKIVIDSWVKKGGNIATDSAPISLVAGRQYDIRIDLSDNGVAPLGIVFYWKSPSMSRFNEVPYSQLYSGNIITPPPIPPIMTPCEEFKWEDYLELQKDLRPAGVDTEAKALRHYQVYGIKENRRANKLCLDPTLVPAIGIVPPPVEREFSLTDKSGVESTFKLVGKTLEIK